MLDKSVKVSSGLLLHSTFLIKSMVSGPTANLSGPTTNSFWQHNTPNHVILCHQLQLCCGTIEQNIIDKIFIAKTFEVSSNVSTLRSIYLYPSIYIYIYISLFLSLYIYIHTYIYIHIYIYVHILYIYIYMIYVYICIYLSISIFAIGLYWSNLFKKCCYDLLHADVIIFM